MYIPKINLQEDKSQVIQFVKQFGFGQIISLHDKRLFSTHLPFLVEGNETDLRISSHLAYANAQWKDIENQEVLLVFTEPHAYISAKHYENPISVPTWNYLAVHIYGKVHIKQEESNKLAIIDKTILQYEPEYLKEWTNFPADYKERMIKGIVAFEIEILEIQGKEKLSQNKTELERKRIVNDLENTKDGSANLLAKYMKDKLWK